MAHDRNTTDRWDRWIFGAQNYDGTTDDNEDVTFGVNSSAVGHTDRSIDRDRDELDNNARHMNDDHLRDDEIIELRQQLADAHARIEQLEDSILHLSPETSDRTITPEGMPATPSDTGNTSAGNTNTGNGSGSGSGSGTASGTDRAENRATTDDAGSGNDPSLLLDRESKLFSEAYFNVALDARLAAAKRHLRPVSIALIEMTEGTGSHRVRISPLRGAEAIRDTLRDADTACRLTEGVYALILEDTPENGAVWTVERVRRNLINRFGPHTMWAGVACYPAHAFSASELLTQARTALTAAKDWNQDRIEVAIAE